MLIYESNYYSHSGTFFRHSFVILLSFFIKMQFIHIQFFLSALFALISSTESIIPIRRINSHRSSNDYALDEKHYHQLLQIANKPYVSILDVDFMKYRPPYLKEFCAEIDSDVDSGSAVQSEEVLDKIAAKFKETVYTEVNFPHTHRLEAEVRVNNDELLTYRRRHCDYKTTEEIKKSNRVIIYLTILVVFAILVFHAI